MRTNPMQHLSTLSIVALALAPTALFGQSPQPRVLILRTPTDTIAIERYTRTVTELKGEVLFKPVNQRSNYITTLTKDGLVIQFDNEFRTASDASDRPARQMVSLAIRADSVVANITTGTVKSTQRLPTKPGALPYINPSFALMELAVARARAIGGDSVDVPMFMVSGGETILVNIKKAGPDSVVIHFAGSVSRFAIDRDGWFLGGVIPSQNVTIVVGKSTAGLLTATKADYSPPAGAPYQARDVTVPTKMGHTLAGTLTLPAGASATHRVAAIVTITGSGLEDRDEYISIVPGGYRPFRQLADTLGRRGIAVLRMDDRGFGRSTGDGATATSADFADDIRAGLAYLRTLPEIDAAKLGLVGHSEGGLIGPMVAATDPQLKGVVLMAGPAQTGRTIIDFQNRYAIEHSPTYKPGSLDSLMRIAHHSLDSAAAAIPWLRFFLDYDPIATAKRVQTPVLILQGATDQQVTADQAPELDRAFKAGGNRDVTMRVFSNANHLFVEDPSGNPAGYGKLPSAKVRTDVLGAMADWLAVRLK